MNEVRFPAMRREVVLALASLADLDYQRRVWLNDAEFDDLDHQVHMLYDDMAVLPDPESRVGSVLVAGDEVGALRRLGRPLGVLLDRLGDVSDEEYMASPEWSEVTRLAALALAAMVRAGVPWPAGW